MIILLDENFPLRFYTRLQKEGFSAQHILLTDRGTKDTQIIARLKQEEHHRMHSVKRRRFLIRSQILIGSFFGLGLFAFYFRCRFGLVREKRELKSRSVCRSSLSATRSAPSCPKSCVPRSPTGSSRTIPFSVSMIRSSQLSR